MKVSLNLIKHINEHYKCGVDPYSYGAEEIVTRIGAQLGAVEDVLHYGPRFDGLVVARVVSCVAHDNSDHLSVCMIDDGGAVDGVERNDDGLVQVVCGAPNVREGLVVAWIPPNATVPSTVDKDPFVLSAREIRGKVSNGMLASPAELGISDNHDGILEIESSDVGEELIKPGTPFKQLYGLDDVVIDCENKMFTHRPDCFGVIGVAREIAGIFNDKFNSPDWYKKPLENKKTADLSVSAANHIPDLVPRFVIQAVADVHVGPSPMWLQAYFARIGLKTISNIVDYTNFFMMETAQPTHAFDYDKIVALCGKDPVFAPRLAKDGEELALLNGKTIKLTTQDMVITANDRPVALAGIMGGSETEVSSETKNIVLECATFDMYAVRRTSMRHGLFTDAVTRFTKGQSPLQNDRVLAKIVDEIIRFADGKVASEQLEASAEQHKTAAGISMDVDFINQRLDTHLYAEDVKELLENVEFGVATDGEQLNIVAPFWRQDIEIPEDIVEEVGRLHGYHKLPVTMPARSSKVVARNELLDFQSKLRSELSAMGANEVKSYSFVHGDLLKKTGIAEPEKWSYHLRNAISPDLQFYRPALMSSLLEKVYPNLRSDYVRGDNNEFALFEIGRAHVVGHNDEDELPRAMERLSFVVVADDKTASRKYSGSAYYQAKQYLDSLTLGQVQYEVLESNDYPITAPYQIGRSAMVSIGGQVLGVIGEYRSSVRKSLKIPKHCAGFELDTRLLLQYLKPAKYVQLPTFPKTQQDITFEVGADQSYKQLQDAIWKVITEAQEERGYHFTMGHRDIFQVEGSDRKRITFRIWLSHHDRTLVTEEVNTLLDKVSKELKKTLNAERI